MATSHVYRLQFWIREEERPWIDSEIPENGIMVPWLKIAQVLNGELPASGYEPVHLVVKDPAAHEWHSYNIAGTYGLLSKEVVALIGPCMSAWFECLDAFVNEKPYCFLRRKATLDCLDVQNSGIISFPNEPGTIMRITHYQFFKERIPDCAVFPISEMKGELFATDLVKTTIEKAGLKGLYFVDLEQ